MHWYSHPDIFIEANDMVLILTLLKSPEERQQKLQEKVQLHREGLHTATGFGHVIRSLIANRKPIIGHNMLFDIIVTYCQFINSFPPEDVDKFKEEVHSLFPL